MKLLARIKQLNVKQLLRLSLLFITHPLYILPTLKATKKTFAICNTHFKNSHHKATAANAFRHVLWNVLICSYSLKNTKNKQKSVFWAQKLTDLYEKVTQNDPLNKVMDLHNNAIGRIYFLNLLGQNEEKTICFILNEVKKAQKVSKIEEMKHFSNKMVFIQD